jgi:hypothetical protein
LVLGAFDILGKTIFTFFRVCPSVRVEQLGSHWKNFRKILYLSIFRKSIEKGQVSLKSDKNSEYFKGRPMHIYDISRRILLRMRNVSDKSCGATQNTHFVFNNFISKIVSFMR